MQIESKMNGYCVNIIVICLYSEDDILILYGSKSNDIPIAIIPWINVNMLITRRRLGI